MRYENTEQLKNCRALSAPAAAAALRGPDRWGWSGGAQGTGDQCLFLDGRHIATVYRTSGFWFWRRVGFSGPPLAAGGWEEARQLAVFSAARISGGA